MYRDVVNNRRTKNLYSRAKKNHFENFIKFLQRSLFPFNIVPRVIYYGRVRVWNRGFAVTLSRFALYRYYRLRAFFYQEGETSPEGECTAINQVDRLYPPPLPREEPAVRLRN